MMGKMNENEKKALGFIVFVVFAVAVGLGILFSDTQDFMGGGKDGETIQVEKVGQTATILVYSQGEEIKKSPIEIELKDDLDLMTYMVENFSVKGADEGFITSIEDIEQNESEGLYWMYYVNEEMPSVGAGDYIVEGNDFIEWKLESFE